MTTMIITLTFISIFGAFIGSSLESGDPRHRHCSFPSFLWSNKDSELEERIWITEEKHISHSHEIDKRKYIVARETELLLSDQYTTLCGNERCVKAEMTMRLECLRNEGPDKVRAKRIVNGFEDITCFWFVMRSKNIVQLWMSRPSDTDMDNLCSPSDLHRQDWPWIAETATEWKPCPLSGGYNFKAVFTTLNQKKKVCERVHTLSRLDIECVVGDGMHFTFAETYCSIFHNKEKEHTLKCLGHWNEDKFTFIVATEEGKSAQYVMRFLRINDGQRIEISLYFSPVCPLNAKGLPPGQIRHMVLELEKAESMPPATGVECDFPFSYQGNWLLFERDRLERVTLEKGRYESSVFGNMICKNKHWQLAQYKFTTAFDNGCQERFTCIEFQFDERESFLKFRISRSSRIDRSFDLCHFAPDSAPLGTKYRSHDFKVLLPVSRCRQFSCGLGGLVHLGLSFRDGRRCDGHLSDWNPFTCTLTSSLALSFRDCKNSKALFHRSFACEAHLDLADGLRILFTKEIASNSEEVQYSCWVVNLANSSSSSSGQRRLIWSSAVLLSRSNCVIQDGISTQLLTDQAMASFEVYTEPFEKDCIIMTKTAKSSHGSEVIFRKSTKDGRYGRHPSIPEVGFLPEHASRAVALSSSSMQLFSDVSVPSFLLTILVHSLH